MLSEWTTKKNSEKKYFNFDDGYDLADEKGPFWDAVAGKEEIDDDLAVAPDTDKVMLGMMPWLQENDAAAFLTEEKTRNMLK